MADSLIANTNSLFANHITFHATPCELLNRQIINKYINNEKSNIFIVRANASSGTQYIRLLSTCLSRVWPPSDIFYNMHGKEYRDGNFSITVKNGKTLHKPASYECPQSVISSCNTAKRQLRSCRTANRIR
jgi:hypothetical protein